MGQRDTDIADLKPLILLCARQLEDAVSESQDSYTEMVTSYFDLQQELSRVDLPETAREKLIAIVESLQFSDRLIQRINNVIRILEFAGGDTTACEADSKGFRFKYTTEREREIHQEFEHLLDSQN